VLLVCSSLWTSSSFFHHPVLFLTRSLLSFALPGIIDHHALQSKIVTTATPIFVDIRPWGSACSIIASLFIDHKRKISKSTAGLLLSGILSDTLNLQSPTTTEVLLFSFTSFLSSSSVSSLLRLS
jgi:nanoRNase/pAp phosphatase (c-di-AMP/oligoRNAs hydrolase)